MKSLIFAAIAISSQFAFAVEENISIIAKPKEVFEDSSEANRVNKSFQVAVQPFGVNPTGAVGSAVTVGYFINRNLMIQADGTSGRVDRSLFGNRYDVIAKSFGLHLKQFFGNSFYARLGLDQRHVDYKYSYDNIFTDDSEVEMDSSFTGDSTAASLVIGNQWQWSNFTLGCDWIGYTQPIRSSVQDERMVGSVTSFDRTRQSDDKEYLVTKGIAQGLRLYLGATF